VVEGALAGDSETTLVTAWRESPNQAVAASIMGYTATKPWTTPHRQWLQRIANQMKAITIVDREALDDDLLFFKREGGGWPRLNRMFAGELDGVLLQFQREMWAT
jgi:type I restriction enzyme R subunit